MGLLDDTEAELIKLSQDIRLVHLARCSVYGYHYWAWLRYRQGRYEEAWSYEQEAIAQAITDKAKRMELASRIEATFILCATNRLEDAKTQIEVVLADHNLSDQRPYALAACALALRLLMQPDEPSWRHAFLKNVSENARTLELARQWLAPN